MSVAATTPAIRAHTWLAPKLSPQDQTPIKLAESIITSYFPSQVHIHALQAKLTENREQDAAAILQEISDLIIEHEADPFAALEKISKYLNLEVVNKAVRSKPEFHTFKGGVDEAKKHLLAAERLIETLYPKIPFSARQAISSILYSIHSVIAGLLGVFGFKDFVKTTQEGPMEGGLKAQKLFILVILFSALATIIMPVAGQLVGAAILGGILLGLIVLTAVYPYIAPTPRELSRCKNWTQLINEHKLPTITGRDAICDSIAGALTSSNEQPLILGKSGAGKTASAQAFAHAVHEGKYPQLKGKSVFYLNAGDLLSSSITGSDNILKTIQYQIGRSSNNVIIVLDEIHTLFKNPNNPIAQQLKSMLDRTQAGSFKYVVGITTEKED
jgi:ATP-dependent Clp protease ATP-binding subunit ClpA